MMRAMEAVPEPVGLYIHVPFCAGKCPYCDFYSLRADETAMDEYTKAVCDCLARMARKFPRMADTLYFGGGTPTLLGAKRLCAILARAQECFGLENAEITVEANPNRDLKDIFTALYAAGVNRLSMGLQSALPEELAFLGRAHSPEGARRAVEDARVAGFENISLDLMLGLPHQTEETVRHSVDFCAALGAAHISAYLLKIEEDTPFARRNTAALCPDGDGQADLYLSAVAALAARGYAQYEISSFARDAKYSRHNLKYWNCEEYLGVGPSAHSMAGGERFYYPRDLGGFIADPSRLVREENDCPAVLEQLAGGGAISFEEYAMLRLRLAEGLHFAALRRRYPAVDTAALAAKAGPLAGVGLCAVNGESIALTAKGFLVSNAIIARLVL